MVNNKHAFWQALIITVAVFGIGFVIGYFFENSRTNSVELNLLNSEINFADAQLRNKQIQISDCTSAKRSTFDFADKIYFEAIRMEDYGEASKFTNTLNIIHKRYDLLRMVLWDESIGIREKCNGNFHTVVYLYQYNSDDVLIKSSQLAMGKQLSDLKEKYPNEILLIPIATNLNLDSVLLSMEKYKIGKTPAILVDEKYIIQDLITKEELERIVMQSNKE